MKKQYLTTLLITLTTSVLAQAQSTSNPNSANQNSMNHGLYDRQQKIDSENANLKEKREANTRINNHDTEWTRKIRQELTKDSNLSTSAKNININVLSGVVTLTGAVDSKEESSRVEQMTRRVMGAKATVHNQLDINVKK